MKTKLAFLLLIVIFAFTGCKNSKEEVSNEETSTKNILTSVVLKPNRNSNERVIIDFISADELSLISESDDEFEIYQNYGKENEKKYVHMTFLEKDRYEYFSKEIYNMKECTIKTTGKKDNVKYVFYEYKNDKGLQYNRICHIVDTEIYMMIYCYDDIDIANKVFENLLFSIK